MHTISTSVLIAVIAAATANAQGLYWASIPEVNPAGPLNPYPPTVFDDGQGRTMYMRLANPIRFYKWRQNEWELLSNEGFPAATIAVLGAGVELDDGSGPAMYHLLQTSTGPWSSVRYRDGRWTEMPAPFWQYESSDFVPALSADFGGGMQIYGWLPQGRICRWNGQTWHVIGQTRRGTNSFGQIHAMIAYDDGQGLALYVVGNFETVNGLPINDFARWDGQTWTGPWPDGMGSWSGSPLVATYDDGNGLKLYSTIMPAINGGVRRGLHRWDGKVWEFLGGPTHSLPEFHGMHVFDDGSGPGLYIVGSFANFGGVPANTMVRYDAQGFHTVPGSPLWTFARGYGVIRDERGESLLIRGNHFTAPPSQTGHTGLLVGRRLPSCPADCDADGRLNVRDFACFINDYAGFIPYANTNLDSTFDVQDFAAYLNRFAAGCP